MATEVQTVICWKASAKGGCFNDLAAAKAWCKEHKFKTGQYVEKDETWHFRQRDPGDFARIRGQSVSKCVTLMVGPLKEGRGMMEWSLTNGGLFQRTRASEWVPDIRCDARLVVRGFVDSAGRLKAQDKDGRLRIRILSSTPDIDEMNEIVEVDAFRSSIDGYNDNPVLLAYHDMAQPVGRAPARITAEGLYHEDAFISSARPDIQQLVLDNVLGAASIGFMVKQMEWDEELEVGRIKDLELIEVSLVPIPTNRSTFVEAARGWCGTFAKAWQQPAPKVEASPRDGTSRVIRTVEMPDLTSSIMATAGAGRLVAAAAEEAAALIAAESRRMGEETE